ncbi:MAG: RNA polymerase sigma factor [Acidimicrobiia bacterium]
MDVYDQALPEVYGYLKPRSGDFALAEDLAAGTFLAACDAIDREQIYDVTVAWLIGIARHKLVDPWRREARRERHATSSLSSTRSPNGTSHCNERPTVTCDELDSPTAVRVGRFFHRASDRGLKGPMHAPGEMLLGDPSRD